MNIEFLKEKITEKFPTQEEFATSLGVTRRTLQNWISKCSIPEDKVFGILDVLDLEEREEETLLNVPQTQVVFRTKHTRKAEEDAEKVCKKIADSFLKLSSNTYKISESIPVLQEPHSKDTIVGTIRKIFALDESEPVILNDVLERLRAHNVSIIFFPFDKFGIDIQKQRREVAFTAVNGLKRIIFLDINRTVDEVLFDLIHELTHIVCGHLPTETTEEDEKFCDSVATEIIYPQMFFFKNETLTEFLRSNINYLEVKEVIRRLTKDFDWCAMGLALAFESHGFIKKGTKSFNRLMQINSQMKKTNLSLDKMYFENFDTSNYDSIVSFFRDDLYKNKEIFNGFIELKNGAIYGHISPSRLSEILDMNRGDVDELVKAWVMEDAEEAEAHKEGPNHNSEF